MNLNDDAEAGTLVRGLSRVARDTGAAVLVLHHEPWAQNREKGSAAGDTAERAKGSGEIVAAADYCLRCEADHNQGETTITPTKRRFGVDAERLVFLLDPGEGFTPAPDDGPRPDLTPTRRSTEDRILIHLARPGARRFWSRPGTRASPARQESYSSCIIGGWRNCAIAGRRL